MRDNALATPRDKIWEYLENAVREESGALTERIAVVPFGSRCFGQKHIIRILGTQKTFLVINVLMTQSFFSGHPTKNNEIPSDFMCFWSYSFICIRRAL